MSRSSQESETVCREGSEFKGRTVVITGASRGIGRACALAFAERGAQTVMLARHKPDLDKVVLEIKALGGSAAAFAIDVTDSEAVVELFARLGRCDVLVNNAGMNRPQRFGEVDPATLDAMLALNIRSVFVTAQCAARLMVQAKSGVIINMSSQMGHVGGPRRTVYCMSKHAVEGLTKAMAIELAPLGIRVNSVAPTYVETDMTRSFMEDEAFRQDVLQRIPMGRMCTAGEVAAAVVFVASTRASMITGTSLLVDGGYSAQ